MILSAFSMRSVFTQCIEDYLYIKLNVTSCNPIIWKYDL